MSENHLFKPLVSMSESEFVRFSRFIEGNLGIRLPEHKKSLLEGRLRRRLRVLGLKDFSEYSEMIFSSSENRGELIHLFDEVTTNKTDFFREPAHFDYLVTKALPDLVSAGIGIRRPLRVWSAGCSTGKEPYTLAMVLSEFQEKTPGFSFRILGTDVSTRVLETARLGIYKREKIAPVPLPLQKKYLLRGCDPDSDSVRIIPELRALINYGYLNFMDEDFGIEEPADIIFCRNVIIYFDRPTQEKVLNRLCRYLPTGRYIFMGHSETLNGMNLPLEQVAPTIYRKR